MERLLSLSLGVLLVLGGCSSMSKSQCRGYDWQTVGHRDGLEGAKPAALLRYQDACLKHGVTPDRDAYLAGWNEGVVQYCQPGNAFVVGTRGAGYGNVCPSHLQDDFRAAYSDGRQIYVARTEVAHTRAAIEQREQRVRDLKVELIDIAAAMLAPEHTPSERAAMLLTAKDLGQEQGRLEAELADLRVELALKTERLARLTSA